jgi:RNA polymerase sigma-70 factor, ECF subfamily
MPDESSARAPLTQEQFMRLFLQSERELLRYVMVLVPQVSDARDVLQETAVALWRKAGEYDPAKPFLPWASRFALNEARMFLRSQARRRALEDDIAELLAEERLALAPQLDRRREHLADCLSRLDNDQRALVRSYYFEERDVNALAAAQGRTVDWAYKSLQRIRRALHHCISRKLRLEAGA